MCNDFLDHGYPVDHIWDATQRCDRLDRNALLKYKQKDLSPFKGITAALDYTPLTPGIKWIVARHWHLVQD